jgi:hypothetical protein
MRMRSLPRCGALAHAGVDFHNLGDISQDEAERPVTSVLFPSSGGLFATGVAAEPEAVGNT